MIARHIGILATALALVYASVTPVRAANGASVPLDVRIQGASDTLVATVDKVTPRWSESANGDRVIVSRVLLHVEEVLKGSHADALSVDIEGGTLDGLTLRVSSLPVLKPGERAVFMLDQAQSGVAKPHLRGLGILKLDQNNNVQGSSLSLAEIRNVAAALRAR